MNWWQCPRCGARLQWRRDVIACPRKACGYHSPVPAPIKTDPDRREFSDDR